MPFTPSLEILKVILRELGNGPGLFASLPTTIKRFTIDDVEMADCQSVIVVLLLLRQAVVDHEIDPSVKMRDGLGEGELVGIGENADRYQVKILPYLEIVEIPDWIDDDHAWTRRRETRNFVRRRGVTLW